MNIRTLIVALAATSTLACLSEHRRGGQGDTSLDGADGSGDASDTSDDADSATGPDIGPDIGNDADVVDPCDAQGVAVSECTTDDQCDDGDPCSSDTCILSYDDCTGTSGICTHTYAEVCGATCVGDLECADGNPCTLDECSEGSCYHSPIAEGICDEHCSPNAVITIDELVSSGIASGVVTTRGIVGLSPATCPPCDDCACSGRASLFDGGSNWLDLSAPVQPSCTSDGVTMRCSPLLAGPTYLVWGMQSGVVPFKQAAAQIAIPMSTLMVQGYCLEATSANVNGTWDGVFDIEGEVALRFTAEINSNSTGSPFMTLSGVDDPGQQFDDVALVTMRSPVELVDGRVEITWVLPWRNWDPETERVRLVANGNTFVGVVGPLFLHEADETLPFGTLRLTRRDPQ